ncbi:hypothetical protein NDR87_24155 [Nocardia sp. CDC159]|uniref:Uncharacterized protein n=1 Tax=Nocardia pulmonis TaxID=2951408 RepID=A0A9X2E9Z9_9NOCA|nr:MULTISPECIES: hypothetical protein [Nocardia]MCM6777044.1 hypothetical protein [Nocardia pulmonis]MCM6789468.1 hypothetical protein [Nocardia sp. CDC159]
MEISTGGRILMIGLHPRALDYSKFPGLDEAGLTARIEAGHAALRAAGFDTESCSVDAEPEAAEAQIRARLATGEFALVLIGAGIRASIDHTLLFERIVNVVLEAAPGVRFCFNTSPETTVDALRRSAAPRIS